MTIEEAMYDYDKCIAAFKKFILDFKPDIHFGAAAPGPGKFYEILDYKLYAWPGHGVKPESSYQCIEAEYMQAQEYDLFITDPSFFGIGQRNPDKIPEKRMRIHGSGLELRVELKKKKPGMIR